MNYSDESVPLNECILDSIMLLVRNKIVPLREILRICLSRIENKKATFEYTA